MGLNFNGSPPAMGGKIVVEIPTPTYSGKKTSIAADSINPYTTEGPGPGGEGQTDTEIEEDRNPATSGGGGSGDPYYADVTMLLPFDGGDGSTTVTEYGSYAGTLTNNNSVTQKDNSVKFGASSSYFTSGTDYYSMTDADDLGLFIDQDFTVEFWWRDNGSPGSFERIFQTANSDVVTAVSINKSGTDLILYASTNGAWNVAAGQSFGAVTTDVFTHFALSRYNDTLYLYRNGILQTSTAVSGAMHQPAANVASIGGQASGRKAVGWMDDFRITAGTARYDGTNFTPPTEPFPNS